MSKIIADNFHDQAYLIDVRKPVQVYRNLNRRFDGESGFWSVRQGTVKFHCRTIVLQDAYFIVNEKGRQRVLETKHKTVHAFVRGYLSLVPCFFYEKATQVTYNPYIHKNFVAGETPAVSADYVYLVKQDGMKVFAENILTEAITSDTIESVPVHLL